MEMKQFIEYAKSRISSLSLEIDILEKRKDYLLHSPNINFSSYGGRDVVKKMYLEEEQISGIRSYLPVFDSTLEQFLVKKEIESIDRKVIELQNTIRELSISISNHDEFGFLKEIYPNQELVREIVLFTKGENTLEYFRSLFSHIFYSDKLAILEKMIANKITLGNSNELASCIQELFSKYIPSYGIENYIEKIVRDLDDVKQSGNIYQQELNRYLVSGKIIEPYYDLVQFGVLLKKSGYSEDEVKRYVSMMKEAIRKEEIQEQNVKDMALAKKFLSEGEIQVLYSGMKLELPDEEQVLLKRAIHNVFSMCRYVEIVSTSFGYGEAMEMLSFKIQELHRIMDAFSQKSHNHAFNYLVDSNFYPKILNDLDFIEVTYYGEILHALDDIALNGGGTLVSHQDDVSFYQVSTNHCVITYSSFLGCKYLVSVCKKSITHDEDNLEYPIDSIRDMEVYRDNPEYLKMNSAFERLLINKLDVIHIEKAKSFGKER